MGMFREQMRILKEDLDTKVNELKESSNRKSIKTCGRSFYFRI